MFAVSVYLFVRKIEGKEIFQNLSWNVLEEPSLLQNIVTCDKTSV
jgi:hypothetical protein